MNKDDIISMAREVWGDTSDKPWSDSAMLHLERFYALAYAAGASAEREACAKVCDQIGDKSPADHEAGGAYGCRDAIRARGNK